MNTKRFTAIAALKTFKGVFSSLALLAFSIPAMAGVGTSLMQTAPVLAPGQFEAKAQADIIFNHGGGFNISPHLATGLIEHYLDGELYFGAGTTNFFFGTMTKYNILPDIEGQVGLSLNFGAAFTRDKPEGAAANLNSLLLTFGVLVSKQLESEMGPISPYASFQFEGLINKQHNYVPLTLIAGAKWQPSKASPWNFYSELSANLHNSLWGIALGAGYPF